MGNVSFSCRPARPAAGEARRHRRWPPARRRHDSPPGSTGIRALTLPGPA